MTPSLLGRTDLVTTAEIEGKTELMLSGKGLAYLLNLPVDEVEAELLRQMEARPGAVRILKAWRIKAQENVARLGTDDWTEILELMVMEREGTN
jgi:hypothetical protein